MKLCPHRQRLMYFFSFSFRAAAFRCKGKKWCIWLRKNVQVFTILSSPSTSFLHRTMKCHPCAVLSQLLVYPVYKLEQRSDLVLKAKWAQSTAFLFFSWPGYFEAGSVPQPTAFRNIRESDRNLLSTKTIKFAEKLLSSSLPRGDVLINGSLLASAV